MCILCCKGVRTTTSHGSCWELRCGSVCTFIARTFVFIFPRQIAHSFQPSRACSLLYYLCFPLYARWPRINPKSDLMRSCSSQAPKTGSGGSSLLTAVAVASAGVSPSLFFFSPSASVSPSTTTKLPPELGLAPPVVLPAVPAADEDELEAGAEGEGATSSISVSSASSDGLASRGSREPVDEDILWERKGERFVLALAACGGEQAARWAGYNHSLERDELHDEIKDAVRRDVSVSDLNLARRNESGRVLTGEVESFDKS